MPSRRCTHSARGALGQMVESIAVTLTPEGKAYRDRAADLIAELDVTERGLTHITVEPPLLAPSGHSSVAAEMSARGQKFARRLVAFA